MKKLFGKFRLRLVLFVLLIGTNYSASSQKTTIAWDNIPIIQSPQVWSFMKYGNMSSVDLYTGTVATSIPIYTYKDSDFEIPISINYASSGFVPNVPTGILGLGWYLNAGGCITREVRGIPDERAVTIGGITHYGYLLHHWNSSENPKWDNVVAYNNAEDYSTAIPTILSSDGKIETLSDIYHFRFGNHRGSFCLGPNRQTYVYNTDNIFGEYNIKMFINNGIANSTSLPPNSVMTITITDGKGYKYTFNGLSAIDTEMDYNTIINLRKSTEGPYDNYICKTFLLRKIETPNHRNVEFEYSDSIKYDVIKPHIYDQYIYYKKGSEGKSLENYTKSIYLIKQNTVNLTKIKIDNEYIISFLYVDKPTEKGEYISNTESKVTKTLRGNQLLSKIQVHNVKTGQELMHCTLVYKTNNGSGNPITFLKSLKINQDPEYILSYYNEDSKFPVHGTPHIDHWGYYNNRTYNHSLNIDNLRVDAKSDNEFNEYFYSDAREPDAEGAKFGMLSKIFYPTGGWTEYIYEGNTYSRKVYRNNTSLGLPDLFSPETGGCRMAKHKEFIYEAGGLRVKKIINHFSDEIKSEKEYIYEQNGMSSGILQHYPRYKLSYKIDYVDAHNSLDTVNIISCTDLFALKIDKHHIAYSNVTEKLDNGSFIKYNYTDYATIPDDTTSTRFKAGKYYRVNRINKLQPHYIDNYLYSAISHSVKRGKIKSKEFFTSDSTLIRKIEYSYNDQQDNYAEGLDMLFTTWCVDKLLVSNFPISKERQVDYCGADSAVVIKTYKYNSLGQLISQKISDGDRFKSNYTYYPTDVPSTYIIDTMIARNMVRYPVMEFTTLGRKSTIDIMDNGIINLIKHEDIIDAYKREYKMNAHQNIQYPVLSSILKAVIAVPVSMNKTLPELDYKTYQSFDVYDKYGNVVQTTSQDNIKTVYIWGYNGRYPVAIIENTVLDAIQQIEGLSDIKFTPLEMELSSNQENALRSLPYAHVTTYTYKPLIGITSITDPSGRRKSYDYDSSGRLVAIKDEDGIILEKFDYQYKNQNQNEQ